jgi:hypothetical protein
VTGIRVASGDSLMLAFRPREWRLIRVTTLVRIALVGLLIGNLGRIPAFSTGQRQTAILLNDLFVAAVLFAGVVHAVAMRSLKLDRVATLALAFAAVGGGSTLYSITRFGLTPSEVLVSLGYLARWLFYFTTYVVTINAARAEDADELWGTLETIILIFAAFGIVQSLTMPDFSQIVYPESRPSLDWDRQGHRLVSTWLDPVFAGMFIGAGLLIEIALISVGKRVPRWKPFLLSIALLLTASRASLGALLVGIGVIVLVRGLSKRLLRISSLIVVLLVAGAPLVLRFTKLYEKLTVDVSGLERVVAWLRAWRVFSEHPIIGIGFNAWGYVQERYGYPRTVTFSYSLDGGLIFTALMTGVVGVTLYVWMMRTVVRRARTVWRDSTASMEHRGLAIGITAVSIALVAHSLFGNSLFLPFLMEMMWVLWAIVFAMSRRTITADSVAS